MQVEEYRTILAKKPTKRGRRVKAPPPLPLAEMLRRHEESQARAPELARIVRPIPRGRRVAIFCLPLELCRSQDSNRHRAGWALAKDRETILESWLRPQWLRQRRQLPTLHLPLAVAARPQVLCVRYGSVEPDAGANWDKQTVDCLQIPGVRRIKGKDGVVREHRYDGLGLIRNDRPSQCEVVPWWEPAEANEGFCVIEVWSG
jgi:hypothetical protein